VFKNKNKIFNSVCKNVDNYVLSIVNQTAILLMEKITVIFNGHQKTSDHKYL